MTFFLSLPPFIPYFYFCPSLNLFLHLFRFVQQTSLLGGLQATPTVKCGSEWRQPQSAAVLPSPPWAPIRPHCVWGTRRSWSEFSQTSQWKIIALVWFPQPHTFGFKISRDFDQSIFDSLYFPGSYRIIHFCTMFLNLKTPVSSLLYCYIPLALLIGYTVPFMPYYLYWRLICWKIVSLFGYLDYRYTIANLCDGGHLFDLLVFDKICDALDSSYVPSDFRGERHTQL